MSTHTAFIPTEKYEKLKINELSNKFLIYLELRLEYYFIENLKECQWARESWITAQKTSVKYIIIAHNLKGYTLTNTSLIFTIFFY